MSEDNGTDEVRKGIGCLLQGLALALVLIAYGIADALSKGLIP